LTITRNQLGRQCVQRSARRPCAITYKRETDFTTVQFSVEYSVRNRWPDEQHVPVGREVFVRRNNSNTTTIYTPARISERTLISENSERRKFRASLIPNRRDCTGDIDIIIYRPVSTAARSPPLVRIFAPNRPANFSPPPTHPLKDLRLRFFPTDRINGSVCVRIRVGHVPERITSAGIGETDYYYYFSPSRSRVYVYT